MKGIVGVVAFILYVIGVVLANGFWSTFFAIFCPLWAYCVAVNHLLIHFGIM